MQVARSDAIEPYSKPPHLPQSVVPPHKNRRAGKSRIPRLEKKPPSKTHVGKQSKNARVQQQQQYMEMETVSGNHYNCFSCSTSVFLIEKIG